MVIRAVGRGKMLRLVIPLVGLGLLIGALTTFAPLPPPDDPRLRCLYGYDSTPECSAFYQRGSELRSLARRH